MKAIIILAALAGCNVYDDSPKEVWWEGATISVRMDAAEHPENVQMTFETMINQALAEWNLGLIERGCPNAFANLAGDEDAHPIYLINIADWTFPVDSAGMQLADGIYVRRNPAIEGGGVPYRVLQHELGHALGLSHAKPEFGPSLMTTPIRDVWELQPRDFEQAACRMGCGPCERDAEWEGG